MESQALYQLSRQIIASAQEGIVVYGPDLRYLLWNPIMEQISGLSSDEVIGRHPLEVFPFLEDVGVIERLEKVLCGEEVPAIEFPYDLPKTGKSGWTSDTSSPLFSEEGIIIGVIGIVREISAQKNTEKLLQNSEEKFKLAFKASPDSININRQEDGVYLDVNNGFSDIMGYSTEEVIGVSSRNLNIWNNNEDRAELIKNLKKHGFVQNLEAEFVTKNGEIRNGLMSARTLKINGENVILSISRDITERKKIEEENKNLTNRLLLATSTARLGVWDWNVRENTMVWDDRMYELYGVTREETPNNINAWLNGLHPMDKESAVAACQAALNGEKSYDTEFRVLHPDGTVKHLKANGLVIMGTDGNPARMLGINSDITERKQNLEMVTREKQMAQTYLDIAAVMLGALDRNGNITLMNKKGNEILGYQEGELIGKNWFDVCLPVAVQAEIKDVFQRQMTGDIVPLEFYENSIVNSAGEERIVAFHNTLLADETGITGVLFSGEDVTERKQTEERRLELEHELRQKYKMEAIGVMAGGMAHNFNNNLSIILGNLELTKMKLSDHPEVGRFVDNAKIAAVRSCDLIKQIMTYSRKEGQRTTPLQLSAVIDEVVALLKSTIPSSVTLQQNIHPDSIPTYIQANASQIQEILLNLCNNAVHAMEEQGRITIALKTVELTRHQIPAKYSCDPSSYLCLSVQDSGCGMTPELQGKVFDPFFTTKELHEGTGMGLSSVQGIMEQLQGMISIESQVGQGTSFHLYFPVFQQAEEAKTKTKDVDLVKGTERILFVDDDEMIVHLYKQMISEMGYQVTAMTDSSEALKLFAADADNFQLVITDQTMPGLTGQELIQKMKLIRSDIPTIICTGYSSRIDEGKARQLGINAFLMKPLNLPELLKTIRQILDGSGTE